MESAWVFSVYGLQWPVTTCMDGFFLLPKRKPLFPQLARVSGKSQEAIQVFSALFSFPVTKLTEASSLEHKDPSFSSLALPFSLPYKVANFFGESKVLGSNQLKDQPWLAWVVAVKNGGFPL